MQGRAPPYESSSSGVFSGEGSVLVELHRQQQHGLLSVKDTGSKARRQAGAVLEAAIETVSSSAMALYAGSLEQQKLSAKGSALAKGHVNRTNVTNGKRANKRMLNFQYIAWVGYRTSHGCQRQRLQRRFFFSGRSQMHTNVDVRAAFLGQGLENRKKLVGNNMNKVSEIYQESCFKFARKNLYETTCFLYGYILLAN